MHYDAVVVGAGHNGLAAAAYLAKAGKRVLVLERLDHLGGLTVSEEVFPGARLSRYSYLVSLLPRKIIQDLGLGLELRRRRVSSYTPVAGTGLLVDGHDAERTAASFSRVTGGRADFGAWRRFYAMTGQVARAVFPTLTAPLMSRPSARDLVGPEGWHDLVERPIGETVDEVFANDVVRGVVLTDALIGTFADPTTDLAANRCFLYHVIGNGTGDWDVPVGGMGAVSSALAAAAHKAGAHIRTGMEVTAVDPGGEVTFTDESGREHSVQAGHVLAAVAPAILRRLLGGRSDPPEGAQLKINMMLVRLPRLRDPDVDPAEAFSGTFHVNESRDQLAKAYAQADRGKIPDLPPCEVYCHTLTDPSILSAAGHAMTLFGLHMPARLFRDDNDAARKTATEATFRSIDSVLAEPLANCLRYPPEVVTPIDLEMTVGLPGGHIFHRDLMWPFAESPEDVGRWGVETEHERILLCGAGARRGGGVSAIPGHNAAMKLLHR